MRLRLEDGVWPEETRQVVGLAGETATRLGTPVYLVGGAVRDLLRGRATEDLDLAVEGEVPPLAEALARALGGGRTVYDRFGTATVTWDSPVHLDLARTRRERYPAPGALPEVEPAPLEEDLQRRDFTVNALALRLDEPGTDVIDPTGGRLDLQLGLLRALHPRSFVDDPTRIVRAARYAASLELTVEHHTLACLRTAVRDGVLTTVTGPRVWGELERLLSCSAAPLACRLLHDWGGLEALGLDPAADLTQLDELYAAPPAGEVNRAPTVAAALALLGGDRVASLAPHYGLPAATREAALAAAEAVRAPAAVLFAAAPKNSTLWAELGDRPHAVWLALWARYPAARPHLERLAQLAGHHLAITGDDLRRAGFAPGPDFGPALEAARAALLDGGADRAGQLQAAVDVLRRRGRGDRTDASC